MPMKLDALYSRAACLAWAVILLNGCADAHPIEPSPASQEIPENEATAVLETEPLTPDNERAIPETAKQEADVSALDWLRAKKLPFEALTYKGGVVHRYSWIQISEITEERLRELNKGAIVPKSVELEPGAMPDLLRFTEAVELVVPSPDGSSCSAVIQHVVNPNAPLDRVDQSQVLSFLKSKLPAYPLGKNCEEDSPFRAGFRSGDIIETDDGTGFLGSEGVIVTQPQRSCAKFADRKVGAIDLGQNPKVRLRQFINFEPNEKAKRLGIRSFHSAASRALAAKIRRDGGTVMQFIYADHLKDLKGLIELDLSLIEEPENDQICLVAEFRQGPNRLTEKLIIRSNSRDLGMRTKLTRTPTWYPYKEFLGFGDQVGAELLAM